MEKASKALEKDASKYKKEARRTSGKKKKEDMMKFEKIIKEKAKEKNIENAGNFFWNLLLDSADYSFNKSHAAAYAALSAQTIYLKFNHLNS